MTDVTDGTHTSCRLSHSLINRLTVIAIYCDLLSEDPAMDAETRKRLQIIRAAARSIAEEVSQHECEPEHTVTALPVAGPQLLS